MSTLAEILKKKKNPAAPLEERLKELINDFETIIKEGKKEIADAVKEAKKSALFDDSDPIEEKAVEAAQAEIFFFKQETQEKIESVVKRLDEKREKVQEEIKKLFEAHKEGLETLDAASEKVNALIEKLDSGLASATEAIANVSSTAKAKVEALKPRDGKDGKDGESIKGDKGDPGRDGSPDTPEEVVDKVNKSKKKIKASQIEGLLTEIADLKKVLRERAPRSSGVGGGGMGNIQHESKAVSSATTTVATNSKIAQRGFAIWAYYQGQMIVRGNHYTVGTDNKTLTLTFTPQDNTFIDLTYVRG